MPTIHLTSELSLEICQNLEPEKAAQIWSELPDRLRKWCLTDVAAEDRPHIFVKALASASLSGLGYLAGKLAALAWLVPVSPGALTWAIHLAVADGKREDLLSLGSVFLAHVPCEAMLAFIPGRLAGAINLCLDLGFSEVCRLPHALNLAGRLTTGVMLVKKQRRCHDCGKPTDDYRCPDCWRKLRGFARAGEEMPVYQIRRRRRGEKDV